MVVFPRSTTARRWITTTPEPRRTSPRAEGSTPPRRRLPHRRLTETRRGAHATSDGRETVVSVSIGYDPLDPPRPREVFCDAGTRSDAALEFADQDLCVIVSPPPQHGVDPREIGRSLSVS